MIDAGAAANYGLPIERFGRPCKAEAGIKVVRIPEIPRRTVRTEAAAGEQIEYAVTVVGFVVHAVVFVTEAEIQSELRINLEIVLNESIVIPFAGAENVSRAGYADAVDAVGKQVITVREGDVDIVDRRVGDIDVSAANFAADLERMLAPCNNQIVDQRIRRASFHQQARSVKRAEAGYPDGFSKGSVAEPIER